MDAQSKKFFTVSGRIGYALARSIPYFFFINVCYLLAAVVEVFGSGDVLDSTVYCILPMALCFIIFLFYPAHSRLRHRIKRIPKNVEKLSDWEKEQLTALCNRLVRRLDGYREDWSEDTYRRAIDNMVYPYLMSLFATIDNRSTYDDAKRYINKVLASLADYTTTSADPEKEAEVTSPAEFTKRIDNALVLLNFMSVGVDQADRQIKDIESHLQTIKNNHEVGEYLKHNTHLSRVLSVYIEHLHQNYNSYHNVQRVVEGGFKNTEKYEAIESHLIKNLELIQSSLDSALQDYIQYEHKKVLASASVLSEFAGVGKNKF